MNYNPKDGMQSCPACIKFPMQRSHDYGIRNPKRQPSPFWTHMQPSPFRAHMQRQTQDAKFVRFENTCLTIANTNLLRANARCVAQMHVLPREKHIPSRCTNITPRILEKNAAESPTNSNVKRNSPKRAT